MFKSSWSCNVTQLLDYLWLHPRNTRQIAATYWDVFHVHWDVESQCVATDAIRTNQTALLPTRDNRANLAALYSAL